jgi:toxin CptA
MGVKGGRNKYSEREGGSDPAWRVVIAIGPSRLVAAHVTMLAAAGMACVLLSGLHGALAAGACALLVVAGVVALRREGVREGRGAVSLLVVDLKGRVEASGEMGRGGVGRLAPGSFVAPWLTVVRWRPEGARFARTVLVAPDAVDADAFRRLRVLLRWGS